MKILIVSSTDYTVWQFRSEFVATLHHNGHDLTVATPDGPYVERLKCLGIRHLSIPVNRFVGSFSDLMYPWRLYRVIKQVRPDFVYTMTTKPNIFCPAVAKFAHVPQVCSVFGGLGFIYAEGGSMKTRIVKSVARKMFRLVSPSHASSRFFMTLIDAEFLDRITEQARRSPRLRMNHNFHGSPEDAVQKFLNAIEPGSYLRPHRHPDQEELFFVVRGKCRFIEYDELGNVVLEQMLDPSNSCYGVTVPPNNWHSLVSLESGTVIFEVKPGPYIPLTEENFAPWAPLRVDSTTLAF